MVFGGLSSENSSNSCYDIIGDVHGFKTELEHLLKLLGYSNETGVWIHSFRTAVFIGDFVDRGPDSKGVIKIVRSMVKVGSALAILGNHELNAILYFTKDANGKSLRVPNASATDLLKEVAAQYDGYQTQLESDVKWLRKLPLALNLGDIRVVHAYWNQKHVTKLESIYEEGRLTKKRLKEIIKKKSPYYLPLTETIKGIEFNLPSDLVIKDNLNIRRSIFRVKWWLEPIGETFKNLSFGNRFTLPDYTIPNQIIQKYDVYKPHEPIVFIGHYCMGNGSLLMAKNVCCVDACISNGGRLAAYRYNGEKELNEDNFVFVKPSRK